MKLFTSFTTGKVRPNENQQKINKQSDKEIYEQRKYMEKFIDEELGQEKAKIFKANLHRLTENYYQLGRTEK